MLKNKLCLALLLILCLFLGGCKKDEQAVTYTELTQSEVGEPGSDWGKSATGSAKYLDGTSVLVTIYLDDVNSLWLESDEQLVADNMKFACDYLAEQGKLYGKENDLIERIKEDEVFHLMEAEMENLLEPSKFTGMAEYQCEKFIRETVNPVLESNKQRVNVAAQINV